MATKAEVEIGERVAMRWVSRGCWLAAWGTWVILGFGLYDHLPRRLGAPITGLPLGPGVFPLGFVGANDTFAIQTAWEQGAAPGILLLNARTGANVGKRRLPLWKRPHMDANRPTAEWFTSTLRRGVLFGTDPELPRDTSGGTPEGMQALDVESGTWQWLSSKPVCYVVAHPTEPWALIVEGQTLRTAERLVVVDWTSGRTKFSLALPKGGKLTERPFFLPRRRAVVLPVELPVEQTMLQIWTIADPPTLQEEIEGIGGSEGSPAPFSLSENGRLLFQPLGRVSDGLEGLWKDVYDFDARRFLTTVPPRERPEANDGKFGHTYGPLRPQIAATGNAVLRYTFSDVVRSVWKRPPGRGPTSTLYEVGDGRILWQASPLETVKNTDVNSFLVAEDWHELWKERLPNLKLETSARRSIATGVVLYRTSAGEVIDPNTTNVAGTLYVAPDGGVYLLPLQVNYPLLALCQTILALPLVVTWLALRWRRKRRLRLASVAP